jgi:phosphatidylserine/phosphatidylglycerophosphate/cardiolipin synthase-like enzyme
MIRISRVLVLVVFTCLFLVSSLSGHVRAGQQARAGKPPYEIGFSPRGEALSIILSGIEQARTSIQVAAYSFTSRPISLALLEAHKRGVQVRVVADAKSNTGKYSAVSFLANQGVPVRSNANYQIFHHKFMIFDNRHLETGSFNYSAAAAEKNAENVLLLRNAPKLAAVYAREWQRLWDESDEVKGRY